MTAIAAFWGVSFLLVITPGADWAYTISAGLRGREWVLPAVVGLVFGSLLATIAVAAGVGSLVASHPMVLNVLTMTGAAYLMWLGIAMCRRPSVVKSDRDHAGDQAWRWMIKGAGVSGLNPKLMLLLLALLPQFVRPSESWSVSAQIMILGVVHATSCCVIYFGVGMASQWLLSARPSAGLLVSRLSGCLMIVIAFFLLAERVMFQIAD